MLPGTGNCTSHVNNHSRHGAEFRAQPQVSRTCTPLHKNRGRLNLRALQRLLNTVLNCVPRQPGNEQSSNFWNQYISPFTHFKNSVERRIFLHKHLDRVAIHKNGLILASGLCNPWQVWRRELSSGVKPRPAADQGYKSEEDDERVDQMGVSVEWIN